MMSSVKKDDPTKICPVCGVTFERKRFNGRLEDRTRFLARVTCSQSCGNVKAQVQADTYRWRARKLKKRDRCEECPATTKLHIHHKDKDVTNNSPENLAVLCASCHMKLHWREDRAERLAAMHAGVDRMANMRLQYTDGKAYSDAQRRARRKRQDEKASRGSVLA